MQKLLTAALLLAGCTLHQANAQRAHLPHKTTQKVATTRLAVAALPPAVVKEFCLNYPLAFANNLSTDYRLEAYYRFKAAGLNLNTNDVSLSEVLSNSAALREVAYQSLYDYCVDIKIRYQQSVDEILFVLLYNDLHMNVGPATLLTQYCKKHYQRLPDDAPVERSLDQVLTESTRSGKQTQPFDLTQAGAGEHLGERSAIVPRTLQSPPEVKVYSYVEQMPALPGGGGVAALPAAIQQNVHYPVVDVRNGVAGKVYTSFLVDENGIVSNVEIVKGLSPTLDAEVVRAVRSLPTLLPGKHNGQPVKVELTIAVALEAVREIPAPREQPHSLYTPKGSTSGTAGSTGANGSGTTSTGDSTGGLEMSGWHFDIPPAVEAVDDAPGVIRFKIKISADGEVESVTKMSSSVSAAQERLCRDKLLDAHFIKTNAGAGGATGFYTFRFTIK